MSAEPMPHADRGDPVHGQDPAEPDPVPDRQLIAMVRAGETAAFAELFIRHRAVAGFVARAEADNQSDAADLVGEAFAVVFQAMVQGKGPTESFKPYLLTTIRRMAHRRNRQARGQAQSTDALQPGTRQSLGTQTMPLYESSVLVQAFWSLPERWQEVLWLVEVEDLKPAAVSRLMELNPNAVSSLLVRAREGFRQAYLQLHVAEAASPACRSVSGRLGKFARHGLPATTELKIRRHLAGCPGCSAALAELTGIESSMSRAPIRTRKYGPRSGRSLRSP
ncbi:sigma-70 family RNA polymerase sigma factor [Paenarthrobacter sp. S56]|uniref:sigma-70 family RNA polymerase sigma factor n=1 Tax=Paenarthrobacter sp. S56 TaxID=3138179 RepID=UPI00321B1CE1